MRAAFAPVCEKKVNPCLLYTSSGELPDYDMATAVVEPVDSGEAAAAVPGHGIFDFPRGARAGTCLHAIFERLDFTQSDPARLEELVERMLKTHGLDATAWTAAVSEMCIRDRSI